MAVGMFVDNEITFNFEAHQDLEGEMIMDVSGHTRGKNFLTWGWVWGEGWVFIAGCHGLNRLAHQTCVQGSIS